MNKDPELQTVIFCECGCGQELPSVDKKGRPRRFIRGHNAKLEARLKPPQANGICVDCGNEFPRHGTKRGHKDRCKRCYDKRYRSRNLDDIKRRKRLQCRELRGRILDYFGRVCACCGESTIEFLALDHIHGGGGKHGKLRGGTYGVYRDVLKDPEAKRKYRLLCHNCNLARGFYGYCPHELTRNKKSMVQTINSTHKVEIVPVIREPHPNADTLDVVKVFGYTCVIKRDDWKDVTKAAYIPPDSLVDVRRPEFTFLAEQAKQDGKARIKAKKLRGIVSFGLMVPVPDDTTLGEDWAERLGVEHYEPQTNVEGKKGLFLGGESASAPDVYHVKYDLEAFRRYHEVFVEGEPVLVTEKCDGCSSRYVYHNGQMYAGSRTEWKKEFPDYSHLSVEKLLEQGVPADKAQEILDRVLSKPKKKNIWWEMLEKTPALEKFCRDNPGVIVYGECYGNVNCIKYGLPDGNRFAAFDLMENGRWMDAEPAYALLNSANIPTVPVLNEFFGYDFLDIKGIPYNFDELCKLAEGPTLVADAKPDTIREGVVIRPLVERYDHRVGRVCLKLVSASFLEKFR